ncbi:UDP-3-O-acyl-N-acetylglucosamine deacetylase [Allorhodopirellula heiligendammensis]|uniref:UDP-3-O-acyl-N-acetylglucosamine deacetylase n=1 Tax=Allorhodopirellula heiligendammensis TaxID=2714739 RepID=A0A5C6BUQ8_9BACT|nr:UDP-3-O-acyl-N-acetylglucosamine deacetylase [Allorhodopirellula heiligendammensis]TWU15778.1 UDP-3-O-[3-hydroxymyristoyl] N-acetylglucosamine deacetylase [Allorhodopirellula heiligendammensis]|tara:strand:- start:1136 stop:2050 length:915 start_codon:yes stop_codon:yes gene_type:complete
MIGYRNEHTIASPCEVMGRGYWSGQAVQIRFQPAPGGTGIVFVRSDLSGNPQCPARVQYANGIQFRTNLENGDARFTMVEHVMAALAGLEVDNCYVEVDAEEMPGLDGSSQAYVVALQSAGLVIQSILKPQLIIEAPFKVRFEDATIEVTPSKGRVASFGYRLAYDSDSAIGDQDFLFELNPRQFVRQVASARTFVTLEQAEQLRAAGIAGHVSNQELLVIGPEGPIENTYRFGNECARHKTLDMIGDLALVGVDLIGQFRSDRGGHRINGVLAQQLSEMLAQAKMAGDCRASKACDSRHGKVA